MAERWILLGSALATLVSVGCNPAKGDYEHCLELEKAGKLEEASKACEAAVQKDPTGPTGKAAQDKIGKLQARIVDQLAGELKKNNACTQAQLALIDAKPEDKARLTKDREEKCKGVLPSSSAK